MKRRASKKVKHEIKSIEQSEAYLSKHETYLSTFVYKGYVQDVKFKKKPIYAVKFNEFVSPRKVFATAIESALLIYECNDCDDSDKDHGMKLLKRYSAVDENFYALAWSVDKNQNSPLIAAGGLGKVIRTIITNSNIERKLLGHTAAINDLKFHPIELEILLSASEDSSIRLWNVNTSVCIVVFAGSFQRSQMLSIDFNSTGTKMISGGMDHNLLVWDLETEEVKELIKKSSSKVDTKTGFPTLRLYDPQLKTRKVHANYVDSVIWHGQDETFVSRSCEGDVVLWKFNEGGKVKTTEFNSITKLHEFKAKNPWERPMWFIRMELDPSKRFLAVGDHYGNILMWDLQAKTAEAAQLSVITTPSHVKLVRMISFSTDGNIMVCVSEDGSILRFDKK